MPGRGIRGLALMFAAVAALIAPALNSAFASPLVQNDTTGNSTSAVEGNSYTSPSFGYTISWGHEWSVTDEQNDADYNKLVVNNGDTSVYFEGVKDSGTLDDCVSTLVDNLSSTKGASKVAQLEDANGPIGGSEDSRSWTVYGFTFTDTDGTKGDYAEYIDCRPISSGESILVISAIFSQDDLDAQMSAIADLLTGLSLTGDTNGPGSDATETPVPENGSMTNAELSDWVDVSASDVDDFWTREFPLISGGKKFSPLPKVESFDSSTSTGCGDVSVGDVGPFYCPADMTVYYDLEFGQVQIDNFGSPSVIAVTMAHEIGHHIENLMGWDECTKTPCLDPHQMTSQEFELLADCFAGAWMADAETRGRMGSSMWRRTSPSSRSSWVMKDPRTTPISAPTVTAPAGCMSF